jgi:hypothetical protein
MLQAAEAAPGKSQLEAFVFKLLGGSGKTQGTDQNGTKQDDSQARTPGVCSRKRLETNLGRAAIELNLL